MEQILNFASEGVGSADTFTPRLMVLDRLISRWRFIACVQTVDALLFCALSLIWFRILNKTSVSDLWLLHALIAVLASAMIHCVFEGFSLYEFSVLTSGLKSATRTFWACLISLGPFAAPLLVERDGINDRALTASGIMLAGMGVVAVSRFGVARLAERLQKAGVAGRRIYIVAENKDAAESLRRTLQLRPDTRVVGTWALTPGPVEASIEGALVFLRHNPTDIVVLRMSLSEPDRLREAARALRGLPRTVLLAPSFNGLEDMICPSAVQRRDGLDNLVLVKISERPLFGWRWLIKEVQDRAMALALLAIASPAFLIISIAIKISDPGPVFFKQRRYGYAGNTFDIIKFRTMRVAEPSQEMRLLTLTTRGDPRVTRVGRFLRKTSLDELPQLLNVLRGDMWIVGPRPHSPFATAGGVIYAQAVREYAARYRIKPGITGWAQVSGWRGPTDTLEQLRNRVEHDLYYIEHWSVLFDAWILMKTLSCAFGDKNAF